MPKRSTMKKNLMACQFKRSEGKGVLAPCMPSTYVVYRHCNTRSVCADESLLENGVRKKMCIDPLTSVAPHVLNILCS